MWLQATPVRIKMEPIQEAEISQLVIGQYTFRLFKRSNGTYRSEPLPEPHGLFPIHHYEGKPILVAEYRSKSHPMDPPHKVFRRPDGSYFCTCTGNIVHHHCWHVDDAASKEEK